MGKKILIALSLVLATGILIFVAKNRIGSASDEDRARQNLISIIESIDEKSCDSDYISEDGSCLMIRNGKTREFLLRTLAKRVKKSGVPFLRCELIVILSRLFVRFLILRLQTKLKNNFVDIRNKIIG